MLLYALNLSPLTGASEGSHFFIGFLKLNMARAEFQLPISYQRAIMEQNFIMIRQLDKIIQLLNK